MTAYPDRKYRRYRRGKLYADHINSHMSIGMMTAHDAVHVLGSLGAGLRSL